MIEIHLQIQEKFKKYNMPFVPKTIVTKVTTMSEMWAFLKRIKYGLATGRCDPFPFGYPRTIEDWKLSQNEWVIYEDGEVIYKTRLKFNEITNNITLNHVYIHQKYKRNGVKALETVAEKFKPIKFSVLEKSVRKNIALHMQQIGSLEEFAKLTA